jgi:hypothetical protein
VHETKEYLGLTNSTIIPCVFSCHQSNITNYGTSLSTTYRETLLAVYQRFRLSSLDSQDL